MPLRKHLSPHSMNTLIPAALSPSVAASMLPTRSIHSPSARVSAGSQPPLTHKHAPAPSATRRVHTHVSAYTHRHPPAKPPCAHRQPPPADTDVPPVTRLIPGLPNPAQPLSCTCVSSPSHTQLSPRALPPDPPGHPPIPIPTGLSPIAPSFSICHVQEVVLGLQMGSECV